jgi:UTP--glucose-1-phosphate uridylyltransferase
MSAEGLRDAVDRMRRDGQPEEAVRAFERAYRELEAGASGTLPDAELKPVRGVPSAADLTDGGDAAALDRTVVVKLSGGLGTTMGMTGPRSLVEARDGLSLLDVIARQTLALRRRHGIRLPLVLMDSFRTREASLAALERHPELRTGDVPPDFLQHGEPRIRTDDLRPLDWPAQP